MLDTRPNGFGERDGIRNVPAVRGKPRSGQFSLGNWGACPQSARIAQVPGVQLQTLYGGVGGAGTSVDLRGFGAFATANTLLLINGRRVNDIDLQGVDFSTIPRDSIERIEITKGNSGAVLYGDTGDGSWYFDLINEGRDVGLVRDTLLFGPTA